MRRPVRAKFRCMGVERRWDGKQNVNLAPLARGRGKDPENEIFWEATPTGSAELVLASGEHPFEPGDYYYIDFEPVGNDTDCLLAWSMTLTHGRNHKRFEMSVYNYDDPADLDIPVRRGRVEIGIDDSKTEAWEALGTPDEGLWRVRFTWAEKSDD